MGVEVWVGTQRLSVHLPLLRLVFRSTWWRQLIVINEPMRLHLMPVSPGGPNARGKACHVSHSLAAAVMMTTMRGLRPLVRGPLGDTYHPHAVQYGTKAAVRTGVVQA